jgi:hypothetical protein
VAAPELTRRVGVLTLLVVVFGACGPKVREAPGPGTTTGIAPDLRSRRVMVLPVQQNLGVRGNPDAELAFGLRERGSGVTWIFPDEIEERLRRSPGVRTSVRGLQVSQFLQAEVERIGDPLFGDLLRMSVLVDAQIALIPIQASLQAEPGAEPTVRFWTTLIDIRTGRVLWFSVLDGQAAPPDDPRGLASAVEEVTRTMLWYSGL